MQATARIFIQKAPAKRTDDKLCPVKLCITHNRDRKYYSIKSAVRNQEWMFIDELDVPKVFQNSPRGKYRDIKFEYDRIVKEAEDIINEIQVFSFGQFDDRFLHHSGDWDNFASAMVEHINFLKVEGRFGYASSFESTLRAVMEYHSKKKFVFKYGEKVDARIKKYLSVKKLRFADITPGWLKKFEQKLKEDGKSRSTIGIYTRNIRVLFNVAIREKKVKAEYPFTNHSPKTAEGRKSALTAHQISLIANHETQHPQERYYRDLFMFSFLGNGVNLSDIARLKYSDIDQDEIVFVREKTKNKRKEIKLKIHITPHIQAIINRWGNRAIGFDAYIFPILRPEWSEVRNYAEIKQVTKQVNKYVRRVALAVGIIDNLSSYTARHSWATIAKNSGTSVEFIKESLGHSSVAVTENYLDSFEKGTRKEHSEKVESQIYKSNAS